MPDYPFVKFCLSSRVNIFSLKHLRKKETSRLELQSSLFAGLCPCTVLQAIFWVLFKVSQSIQTRGGQPPARGPYVARGL